jgi:hypothetical protein
MSRVRLLLIALCLTPGASLVVQSAEPSVTFASVTRAHYAEWAKGVPDGKLTPDRVNALVNSSRIKGDEAAALAAIHVSLRRQGAPPAVDEVSLLSPQNPNDPEERRDQQTKPINFERVFGRYRRHIQNAPRVLFDKHAPVRAGISQGQLGDCFVVSAVGTLVSNHPGRLKGMIHEQPDGAYMVTFPGKPTIRVPKLTDAQIVLGSTAGDQGLWLNVMEEAVAIENRSTKNTSSVVIDQISKAGSVARTMELLTAHKAKGIPLHDAAAKNQAATLAEARKALLSVHDHKVLACLSTVHRDKLPPGMASGHAYGVVGYDPSTEQVTVWNPWGNHFEPKGKPGLENGYATQGGAFDVPLKEFVTVFTDLFIQTPEPVKKN